MSNHEPYAHARTRAYLCEIKAILMRRKKPSFSLANMGADEKTKGIRWTRMEFIAEGDKSENEEKENTPEDIGVKLIEVRIRRISTAAWTSAEERGAAREVPDE